VYVVSSVKTPSLTETILIEMLFLICCQVSTKCKQLCSPNIDNFKEF